MLYCAGYSTIRNFILKRHHKAVSRFLVFHDVLPESAGSFEKKLCFLKEKTNVISLENFVSGELDSNKINTVITFDDGYKSWVVSAIPVLKRLKLPATFFISSGFIGLSKQEEATYIREKLFRHFPPGKISGRLTLTEVRALSEEGFTIGGHTLNHVPLNSIDNLSELKNEIRSDKSRLEDMIESKIDYFSYPTGAYSNPRINLINELIDAGYKAAVTVKSGFNTTLTNKYLLHRDIIFSWISLPIFRARVLGNVDAIRIIKSYFSMAE